MSSQLGAPRSAWRWLSALAVTAATLIFVATGVLFVRKSLTPRRSARDRLFYLATKMESCLISSYERTHYLPSGEYVIGCAGGVQVGGAETYVIAMPRSGYFVTVTSHNSLEPLKSLIAGQEKPEQVAHVLDAHLSPGDWAMIHVELDPRQLGLRRKYEYGGGERRNYWD